ncbi:peptidyl-prolyl cis-trans isomerase [Falsibacillus pallidus]|uniref:peptidyl-prolyl cis-trans isomerase n=1 Tax=Falsibacillus pallidus TaxID=493781 RepID=UPI003D97D3DF
MGKKQLWFAIGVLLITNIATLVFFIAKQHSSVPAAMAEKQETVATIGGTSISREDWLHELDQRYGKSVLRDLIDEKVVKQMADKYGVKAPEKEIEQEVKMYKSVLNPMDHENVMNEEQLKREIQTNLLLEELVTKDVSVSEDDMKRYYERNKDLYDLPDAYRISMIVSPTKEEAEKTEQELKDGSHFDVLAMERSIDAESAPQGGDIGYISEQSEEYPAQFLETAKSLKENEWSKPIPYNKKGYAILLLKEKVPGTTYEYQDVKDQIRRQIALEHIENPMNPENFWKEAKVKWFYGGPDEHNN